MKRNRRRILSVLLACLLLLLPVMEAAASSYDLALGTVPEALFPGESLSGITPGTLTVDGTPVDTPDGTWTNSESGKVYSVTKDDAGNYSLAAMGYTLTVKNGSSAGSGEAGGSGIHQTEGSDGTGDTACYNPGDQVVIKAADPEEGMRFSGWKVESPDSGFTIDDPSKDEQTITMPDVSGGVVIAAQYEEVSSGEIQPEEVSAGETQPAENQPVLYTLTVNNGSGSGRYAAGEQVSVSASDRSGEGLQFAGWEVENWWSVSLEDSMALTVVFTMPEEDTTFTAQYVQAPVSSDDFLPEQDIGIDLSQDPNIGPAPGSGENMDNSQADIWIDSSEDMNGSDDLLIEGQEPVPMDEVYPVSVEYGSGSGEYAPGTRVMITAQDRSAEGLVFNGWAVTSLNVALEDLGASETAFEMPAAAVMISAGYTAAAGPEPQTESETFTEPVTEEPQTESETFTEPVTEEPQTESETSTGLVQTEPVTGEPQTESETSTGPVQTEPVTEEPQTESETSTGPVQTEPQTESETSTGPVQTEPQTESETSTGPVQTEPQTESETSTAPPQSETNQTEPPTEEQVYRLTVENGQGSGEYAAGAIVAIEADEREGMVFSGWVSYNDNVVISNPSAMVTTLIMPAADVMIAADYVTAKYQVTLDCGDGKPTKNMYTPGETVEVKALDRKEENLQFDHWTGTQVIAGTSVALPFADPKSAETTFVMPQGEVTVTASYTPLPSTYHVTVSNGLINGSYKEMDCEEGSKITVTANPGPEGQKFSEWVVNDGKVDLGKKTYKSSIKVSVTRNMNFLAVYEGIEYKVTVNHGTGDYQKCTQGTTVTIQADEAEEGMAFDHWEVNAGSISPADASQSQTTFTMSAEDVEVTACYRKAQYQLAVENGTSESQYYYMGDTVTISSSYPASGREFDGWVSDGGNVEFADSGRWQTTFTMPAANVVVKATYADGPSPDGNTIQNVEQGGQYYTGDTIEFTASGAGMDNTNPNPGDYRYRPASYQIGNVTGTWQGAPYSTSMAINSAGEYTLKVIYNKDVYTGSEWETDGTVDTKSVTFRVDSGRTSVETGDETPIELVVGVLVASGAVFIVLLILFLRRKRRK